MRIALVETIVGSGGHEVEHNRQIIKGLQAVGCSVQLWLPACSNFPEDYGLEKHYLRFSGVSYKGAKGLSKIFLSLKREYNRLRWFSELADRAMQGEFDAILFPTATYRFMRSLLRSKLRRAAVPVVLGLIGVTPRESDKFFYYSAKLQPFSNVKMVVYGVSDNVLGKLPANVYIAPPALYFSQGKGTNGYNPEKKLQLAFIGQYRREKDLRGLIQGFLAKSLYGWADLTLQAVASKPDDRADLLAIKDEFADCPGLTFVEQAFYGQEWNEFIDKFDVIVVPYADERFKQHGSGALLSALGASKPVVIADAVWPELLAKYNIGQVYETGNRQALWMALEKMVKSFADEYVNYQLAMNAIHEDLSADKLGKRLQEIIVGESRC